jgi:hypothetical protein
VLWSFVKEIPELQLILCGCVIIHVTIPPTKKKEKKKREK